MQTTSNPAGKTQNRLVRKNRITGVIENRHPGRPHPDFAYGWMDEKNDFHEGNPPEFRRAKAISIQPTLEQSVMEEVRRTINAKIVSKLEKAKAAALKAFTDELSHQ